MKRFKDAEAALATAKDVGRRTRELLVLGNDNPYSGVPGSRRRAPHDVDISSLIRQMRSVKNPISDEKPSVLHSCYTALNAIRYKCGNCGEHAAVAFMLLIGLDFSGFDLVGYHINTDGASTDYDHAFVRLNCENRDYVICDPWADRYEESRHVANPRIEDNWAQAIWGDESPSVRPSIQAQWNPG